MRTDADHAAWAEREEQEEHNDLIQFGNDEDDANGHSPLYADLPPAPQGPQGGGSAGAGGEPNAASRSNGNGVRTAGFSLRPPVDLPHSRSPAADPNDSAMPRAPGASDGGSGSMCALNGSATMADAELEGSSAVPVPYGGSAAPVPPTETETETEQPEAGGAEASRGAQHGGDRHTGDVPMPTATNEAAGSSAEPQLAKLPELDLERFPRMFRQPHSEGAERLRAVYAVLRNCDGPLSVTDVRESLPAGSYGEQLITFLLDLLTSRAYLYTQLDGDLKCWRAV
jgi:hypothetical protein